MLAWLRGASSLLLLTLFVGTGVSQTASPHLRTHQPEDRTIVFDAVDAPGGTPEAALLWKVDGVAVAPPDLRPLPAEPVQVLLMLDALNCSPEELRRSVEAVSGLLASNAGHLAQPTSILILSGSSQESGSTPLSRRSGTLHRIPPSMDGLRLRDQLHEASLYLAMPSSTIADRVRLSLNALGTVAEAEAGQAGPKLLLWISPGWPSTRQGFHGSAAADQQIFDSIIRMSELLVRARILLYALDPAGVTAGRAGFDEGFLLMARPDDIQSLGRAPTVPDHPGDLDYLRFVRLPATPATADANELGLQALAVQSGGLVVQHENSLGPALARCLADAGRVRSVSYLRPGDAAGTLQQHTLEVRRAGDQVVLRSRQAFYSR